MIITDNYLAATGLSQYYEPQLRLKATLGQKAKVGHVMQQVQKLYDDDVTTCAQLTSLKIIVYGKPASHVFKPILFETMTLVPDSTDSSEDSPPSSLTIKSFEGSLNRELLLTEATTINLTQEISDGDTVMSIKNEANSSANFTVSLFEMLQSL